MFAKLLKAHGWTPYHGKGKRTGTPGHYEYEYEEPKKRRPQEQLSLWDYQPPKEPVAPPKLPNPASLLRDTTHWARYGARGAPEKGEKGHKGPAPAGETGKQAASTLASLRAHFEDPEWTGSFSWHLHNGSSLAPEEADPVYGHTWGDLAAFVGVPAEELAGYVDLAMEADPMLATGADFGVQSDRDRRKVERGHDVTRTTERVDREGMTIPRWLAEAVVEDAMAADRTKRIVNVDKETAIAFVGKHHSAFGALNPRGLVFAIGLKVGERLVAVATANTPTGGGSPAEKANELELSRIASDGTTPFASSALANQILRAMEKTGRGRLVTYSLSSERGTTYRAMESQGMRAVGWTTRGGSKAGTGRRSTEYKIRWEAGPDARTQQDLEKIHGKPPQPPVLETLDRLHTLNAEIERTPREAIEQRAGEITEHLGRWAKARKLDTPTLRKLVAMRGKPAKQRGRDGLLAELAETVA